MLLAVLIPILVMAAGHVLSQYHGSHRLVGVYECGFPALGGGRRTVPILFFLVAILFLLFDLELLALMPSAILGAGPLCGGLLLGFFGLLTVGFWAEWRQGAIR